MTQPFNPSSMFGQQPTVYRPDQPPPPPKTGMFGLPSTAFSTPQQAAVQHNKTIAQSQAQAAAAAAAARNAPPDTAFNQMVPGAGENYYNANANRWTNPTNSQTLFGEERGLQQRGIGENYAGSQLQKYQNGTPQTTNLSANQYQNALAADPNLAPDAGFGQYYQNAEANAAAGINAQMAARGLYGSSAATGQLAQMYQGMEGDRANREAQYNLARAAENRGWQGLFGQLAGQSDTMSGQQSHNQLAWMQGLGGLANQGEALGLQRTGLYGQLANQADVTGLNYLNSGMNAAQAAQGLGMQRGQNMFNNELNFGNAMSGAMGQEYNGMFGTDLNLFNTENGMGVAAGTEQTNQNQLQNQQLMQALAALAKSQAGGGGG